METKNKKSVEELFRDLKTAYEECWKAKIATNDIARKYAPICVKIMKQLTDSLGYPLELINQRIQKRTADTDGRTVFDEDFWADEDMIIALFEHVEEEFNLLDSHKKQEPHAST